MRKFWMWIAEQLADGLEKSTVGAITMFGVMACVIYLVVKEGGSQSVESLLTTAMIVSATLMGVNSVTDIFKKTETLTRNEQLSSTTTSSTTITEKHESTSGGTTSESSSSRNNNTQGNFGRRD